jgi:hypothetical protein
MVSLIRTQGDFVLSLRAKRGKLREEKYHPILSFLCRQESIYLYDGKIRCRNVCCMYEYNVVK